MLRCWEASVPARANRCWEKLMFLCWNHAGGTSSPAACLSFLPGWGWVMLWQCFSTAMISLMVIMERSWHSQTALFGEALAGKGQKETDNSSNVPFNTSRCRAMCAPSRQQSLQGYSNTSQKPFWSLISFLYTLWTHWRLHILAELDFTTKTPPPSKGKDGSADLWQQHMRKNSLSPLQWEWHRFKNWDVTSSQQKSSREVNVLN